MNGFNDSYHFISGTCEVCERAICKYANVPRAQSLPELSFPCAHEVLEFAKQFYGRVLG